MKEYVRVCDCSPNGTTHPSFTGKFKAVRHNGDGICYNCGHLTTWVKRDILIREMVKRNKNKKIKISREEIERGLREIYGD